ncbi:MAG: hypothetical protein ACT4NV_08530 [Rhodoferax sp.]
MPLPNTRLRPARIGSLLLSSLALPAATAWAQAAPVQMAQLTARPEGALILPPFKYIPNPSEKDAASGGGPKRPPAQQRIVDLNTQGRYAEAGREGLALLSQEGADDGLKLIIANSLAWSGRLRDATQTYQGITAPEQVNDANVGIANILRWRGRDEQAAPIYREVLEQQPDHADSRSGLDLAEREMAPRTTIMVGASNDSAEALRQASTVNHRWRDGSGFHAFEVEAGYAKDSQLPSSTEEVLRDVTVRYQALGLELKPALELSTPTTGTRAVYGHLRLFLLDDMLQLTVGQVNWGKMANNPNVLNAGLSATQVGFSGRGETALGELSGRFDYYNVSDSNTVVSTDVRLTSNLRPLGDHFKPFIGVESRKASFRTANYWSPDQGSGAVYGGLQGEWSAENWNIFGAAQLGLGLYGEAGTSWSLSGGAKRWITSDVALSLSLWGMSSWRSGSEYRAQAANVLLEKIWR